MDIFEQRWNFSKTKESLWTSMFFLSLGAVYVVWAVRNLCHSGVVWSPAMGALILVGTGVYSMIVHIQDQRRKKKSPSHILRA